MIEQLVVEKGHSKKVNAWNLTLQEDTLLKMKNRLPNRADDIENDEFDREDIR